MPCPFCQADSVPGARACHRCGGPLCGIEPPVSPSLQPAKAPLKGAVPLAASPRLSPTLPPAPIPEVEPAKPVLVARRARATGAPRIVAAFCGEEKDSCPLLVLENGELQGWDVPRDELQLFRSRRTLRQPGLTTCAAVSPRCERVATGHESGQVRLQRLELRGERAAGKCRSLGNIEAHRGRVLGLAMAKNRLYSAGADGAVVLTSWPDAPHPNAPHLKLSAGGASTVILDGLGALSCLALSPDGRGLCLGADDGRVQMWRLSEDGAAARLDWTLRPDRAPIKSLAFSPNGNMLVSRSAPGLCLWAAQTGHRLQWMAQPNCSISPAFAPDSRLLAHANSDAISLIDAWTGTLRHTLPPVAGAVQALGFSPASEPAPETLLIVAGSLEVAAWKVGF